MVMMMMIIVTLTMTVMIIIIVSMWFQLSLYKGVSCNTVGIALTYRFHRKCTVTIRLNVYRTIFTIYTSPLERKFIFNRFFINLLLPYVILFGGHYFLSHLHIHGRDRHTRFRTVPLPYPKATIYLPVKSYPPCLWY